MNAWQISEWYTPNNENILPESFVLYIEPFWIFAFDFFCVFDSWISDSPNTFTLG